MEKSFQICTVTSAVDVKLMASKHLFSSTSLWYKCSCRLHLPWLARGLLNFRWRMSAYIIDQAVVAFAVHPSLHPSNIAPCLQEQIINVKTFTINIKVWQYNSIFHIFPAVDDILQDMFELLHWDEQRPHSLPPAQPLLLDTGGPRDGLGLQAPPALGLSTLWRLQCCSQSLSHLQFKTEYSKLSQCQHYRRSLW